MTSAEVLREITYPWRTLSLGLALVFTTTFVFVAIALIQLGSVFVILGGSLLFLFVPVYFRYLLYVLEARAAGRQAPVLAVEMVEPWNNLRLLAPPVLYTSGYIATLVMVPEQAWLQLAYVAALLAVLPASLAILAITRSALESLHPMAIVRTMRACGPRYAFVPAVIVLIGGILVLPVSAALPGVMRLLAANYVVMLLFTLTASLLREKSLATDIDIGAPAERSAAEDDIMVQKARQRVANHAYGMISRGNRAGGFAHIDTWLASEANPGSASNWFFNEMLSWQSANAALFYAQHCLAELLRDADDRPALKLITRCLHEDPRWKPAAEDRAATLQLLERYQREDLRKLLSA